MVNSLKSPFAAIPVGFRNALGQPRMEALKRLEDSGARVDPTDVNGAVTFYLDGHWVTPWLAALH
jgi:beta-lactamase superfamily II metal-dependent hydrolase